jgi:hypothetical protein
MYINPNAAADELIDPAMLAFDCMNVPAELAATAEYIQDVGEYESVFQDIWMEFKLK